MKIYKVTVYEVGPEPTIVVSSFRADRTERKAEYYLDKEKALSRCKQIDEGLYALAGFAPRVETKIQELDVIE